MAEFHEDDADYGDEEQKDGPADEGDADGLGGGPGAGAFIPGAVVLGCQGVHVAHDADEEGHEVEGREAAAHGSGEEKLAQFGEEEAVHEEVDSFRGLAHYHGQGDNADVLEPGRDLVGVLPGGRIRGGRIPGGRGIGKRDGFRGGCVAHDDEDYSPLSIHGEAPGEAAGFQFPLFTPRFGCTDRRFPSSGENRSRRYPGGYYPVRRIRRFSPMFRRSY